MSEPRRLALARHPLGLFGIAVAVAFGTFLAGRGVPESVTAEHAWARQAVTQGLMLAFSLGAMALSRRSFAEFGFRRPTPAKGYFKLWGLALGVAMTGLFLALGLKGMTGTFAAYGLLGWILWIWIISSVVEEIFCRAWFQTLLGPETRHATIWSAALFGTMHLPLLFSDMHVAAVMILLVSVTALGYICATARARTGSLRPAVFAHVLFNVGGLLAGVIYTIAYRIATGHLPQM